MRVCTTPTYCLTSSSPLSAGRSASDLTGIRPASETRHPIGDINGVRVHRLCLQHDGNIRPFLRSLHLPALLVARLEADQLASRRQQKRKPPASPHPHPVNDPGVDMEIRFRHPDEGDHITARPAGAGGNGEIECRELLRPR